MVATETASSENPKMFTTWPSTEKKFTIPFSRLKREYKEFGKNVLELKEIQHLEKYQRKRLSENDPGSLISKQNSSSNHGRSTDYLSRITSRNKQKLAYLQARVRIALKGQGTKEEERGQ